MSSFDGGRNSMLKGANQDNVFYRDMHYRYLKVDRGRGIYIYDETGKRYIDASSGPVAASIGHGVEEIKEAMARQADKISYAYQLFFTNGPQIELAEKVIELAPHGMSKVYFVSGGSEASETALKVARFYHIIRNDSSRYKVVSRWQSYHGNTIGALSMSGHVERREHYIPYLINFPHISPAYCYRCPFKREYPGCGIECAHELERVIKQEGKHTIAAFIAEPVSGSSIGAAVPPPEYFKIIRSICDKYEILFIVDEVMTGFGRTGKNFGIDHWEVIPDIMIIGKGVSCGYTPLGAVILHEKVVDEFLRNSKTFSHHGFTWAGNPLSCAIALEVQNYIQKNNLIERVAELSPYLSEKLNSLKEIPIIGDVRGKGFLMGIEFVKNQKEKTPFERERKITENILEVTFEKGLLLVGGTRMVEGMIGDHVRVAPPFIVKKEDIDDIITILKESILDAMKKLRV